MNILLVQPRMGPSSLGGDEFYVYEPLALEYLAAAVGEQHEVRILDMRLEEDLRGTLEDFRPALVGITAYTVHVNTAKRLFREVKSFDPAILTVVGGHHATVRPADFDAPGIDVIVVGEGVLVFRELVERLIGNEGFDEIPGLYRVRDGSLIGTPAEPIADLDAFPFPDRSTTARYRGRYFSEWMRPLASIRTSKGCPFRCRHCALWKLADGKYLRRSPDSVVEELARIEEEYVFFADDESLLDARRMARLAGQIEEAGIRKRYFLYGRSDTIVRHADLLETWRRIGLERIFVGLEFFRDADMDYVGKGSSIDQNEEALTILRDLGIDAYASFMIRPEYDRSDFREYRRYCRRMPLNFTGFSILTPLPGTDLYEERRSDLITRNWDHFDFIHTVLPTCLPLKDFYREYSELLQKAVPVYQAMSFLSRFPARQIPGVLKRSLRLVRKVRKAYRDHEGWEAGHSWPVGSHDSTASESLALRRHDRGKGPS